MKRRFVISDLHLGHSNVIKFERTEFNSIEEHDAYIVKKWNSVVKENDTVYVLGDVAWHPTNNFLKEKLSLMKGHKILIRGNHDHNTKTFYKISGFDEVHDGPFYIFKGKIILSHEPVKEAFDNPFVFNVHGHLHKQILSLPNFICVSAKTIKYTPLNLSKIEEEVKEKVLPKRKEKFGEEWYAPFVKNLVPGKN